MKKTQEVTCRYGVKYKETLSGTKGEIFRGFDHLANCCCWTCYNHDCTEPRNEIIPECHEICEIWFKTHPCKK